MRRIVKTVVIIAVLTTAVIGLFPNDAAGADVNILVVGSTRDSGERHHAGWWWNDKLPLHVPDSEPFSPTQIGTELDNILSQAGLGTVNVTVKERYSHDSTTISFDAYCYNLATWFHYPYPAGADTNRWADLRGDGGTNWDYVVLIGDPYTMEYTPGMYAHGAAKIAEEIAKGPAETVLLMPWPASGSSSSVAHYKDVVYRTGRSGNLKIAPAGLAWEDAGSPTGPSHPSNDGAFIAAASIYSRLWGQSASSSDYTYNDTLADTVYSTVTNNIGKRNYDGTFDFQNSYLMEDDHRREIHMSEKGTSTEAGFKSKLYGALNRCNVDYVDGIYNDKYTDSTPEDDGKGWPTSQPMPISWNYGRDGIWSEDYKSFEVNTSYWQIAYAYYYHASTWGDSAEDANDTYVGLMQLQDNDMANRLLNLAPSGRNVPLRTLWAQIHQADPSLRPQRDGSGPHLNYMEDEAVGTYMYTLYSGRCPLGPEPATPSITWTARKIGYETAWRLGRCQTRAPGFKVTPTSASATDVTPTSSQTLSVVFIMAPTSDVIVAVSTDDPYKGTASPSVLTFTPSNYTNAQTVTVSGVTGPAGSYRFNTVLTTSSDDPVYDGVSDSWDFLNTRNEGPLPSDIRILGNDITIISGDAVPDTADDTDFGITSSSVAHTFTITNLSSSTTVNLTDSPKVTVTDPGGHFTLSQDASTATLSPGSSTTFELTYQPLSVGAHTAVVSIASTDTVVSNYTFVVQGVRQGAPAVTTQGAVAEYVTSARLSGMLSAGGAAEAWFCWGESDAGTGSTSDWDHVVSVGTVTEGTAFSSLVSDLTANTSYVFRCFATNTFGIDWSASAENFSGMKLGAALASKDYIIGESDGPTLDYYVDGANDLIGASGSSGDRSDKNVVLGYSLPTLDPGISVTGGTFRFEIIAARDSAGTDPALHVYLLNTANPDSSGTAFFYQGASNTTADAKFVGEKYIDLVGDSEVSYSDGQYDVEFSLTGEALALMQSFYGGDHVPDQDEAFFRFNLDVDPSVSPIQYNRYRVNIADQESVLELLAPDSPPAGAMFWWDQATSGVTSNSASLSATVNTNLTKSVLVWDISDNGTGSTNDWPVANRLDLGIQSAGTVTGQLASLNPDTEYIWRFYGQNTTTTGWSGAESFITHFADPQIPAFTNAVALTFSSIQLDWQDNASEETGYVLQRSINAGSGYVAIDTVAPNTTTYTDAGLSPSTTYYYRLAATNSSNGSSTDSAACQTNATTDSVPGGTLVSWDSIVGESDGPVLDYYVDASNNVVGVSGGTGSKTDKNLVLGYVLPTLDPGVTVTGAVFNFEITAARDDTDVNPSLHVYLLNTANPDSSGTDFFYQGASNNTTDAKFVGEQYIEVGQDEITYSDDQHDIQFSLTGEALALIQSFYGGDHIPDQTEAFFRFNLDVNPSVSSSDYNRYRIDLASDESALDVLAPDSPPPAAIVWWSEATLGVTSNSAWASATVDTNLTRTLLVWDTADNGTDSTNDWPTANRLDLGIQSAGVVTGQLVSLSSDTEYTWRFYGENATTTGWSAAESFITPLSNAQNPAFTNAVALSFSGIQLEWQDNATHETEYVLQRSTNAVSGYVVIDTLGSNVTTYADSGLVHSTTYYYRLAATNSNDGSSTDATLCMTNATTDSIIGGTLVSQDSIVGRRQASAPALDYYVDASNAICGVSGSDTDSTRNDRVLILGYALPTLPAGTTVSNAVFNFEITAARDHNDDDPSLHVYMLNTSNPDSSGTTYYYHGPSNSTTEAKYVDGTYIAVGVDSVDFADDEHDQSYAITSDALALLQSFYGGDNVPDQSEVFFRFNMDINMPALDGAPYERYYIDLAADESSLQIISTTPTDPDADSDGMPDEWETTHFGSLTNSTGTASDDYDGDGFIDLHEYLAGTNPTNSASLFAVTGGAPGPSTNQFVLSWWAVTNKTYRILSTGDLIDGPWATNAFGLPGIEPSCVYTTTTSGAKSYFRIELDD